MTKITKAEFDTLPESLKAKFEADGDGYSLVEADVEGLKKSKAEILEEKKRIQAERDELAQFKSEHEASLEEQETAKQKEAGQFAELEKKLRDKITETESAAAERESSFLASLKRERLQNFWVEKGVLADRADLAVTTTESQFDLVNEDGKFNLKLKDGIGDAGELDKAAETLKTSRAYLFAPNGASGSGASGSQSNAGGIDLNSMSPEQMLDMANAATTK